MLYLTIRNGNNISNVPLNEVREPTTLKQVEAIKSIIEKNYPMFPAVDTVILNWKVLSCET